MSRSKFIYALILGSAFVAGCEDKPSTPATQPSTPPAPQAPATAPSASVPTPPAAPAVPAIPSTPAPAAPSTPAAPTPPTPPAATATPTTPAPAAPSTPAIPNNLSGLIPSGDDGNATKLIAQFGADVQANKLDAAGDDIKQLNDMKSKLSAGLQDTVDKLSKQYADLKAGASNTSGNK